MNMCYQSKQNSTRVQQTTQVPLAGFGKVASRHMASWSAEAVAAGSAEQWLPQWRPLPAARVPLHRQAHPRQPLRAE